MHLLAGAGVVHELLPAASLVIRVCDISKRCIPDFSALSIAAGLVMLMVMQQPQQQAAIVQGVKDDTVKLVALKGDGHSLWLKASRLYEVTSTFLQET